jgi:dTDP-4-amino-4,6-dideoxygalactose transaminase
MKATGYKIPFNIPYTTGRETEYISMAIENGHLSGNGPYTKKCHTFFEQRYGFEKVLLTTSCTDALEMAALLIDIKPGDEVIIPSFTFVSTALAFARQGAIIRFADSRSDHPGIDEALIEPLINKRTKAIVPVHYAGVACDMDIIMNIANRHNLFVIEDAAHAIDSRYKGKPLGGIGHFGCFSFHETKGIHCGEGGMLVINDKRFAKRAEMVWEKGTNRAMMARGEAEFYEWRETGSSFLPPEITAAFLYAQLEEIDKIQARRIDVRQKYYSGLREIINNRNIGLPEIPDYSTNNGHLFYLVCSSSEERKRLITHLGNKGIQTLFHYLPLHKKDHKLPQCTDYSERLIRFPLYSSLNDAMVNQVIKETEKFLSA